MMRFFKKKQANVLSDLGPLYHNYSFFGVDNEQLPGNCVPNQKAKAPILTAYIAYAIAKSKEISQETVSFTELFCADGYYAMVAARLGCEKSIGIDNNRDNFFQNAPVIAQRLKIPNVEFIQQDIVPGAELPRTDIVANVGGLYHVDCPREILELSYATANQYLIVQNVVSMANDEDDYFECPAPGWSWGNRYNRKSFDKLVRSVCSDVIDTHFNKLDGNQKLEDRGSVYYLIGKDK